jgi:predicted nucleic acid-binding protein
MLVIDTNILFASIVIGDATHVAAKRFLLENKEELHAPNMLKLELMSLLARKFGPAVAEIYFRDLTLDLVFHEDAHMEVLVEYTKHKKIRCCDNFFAYLADQLGCKVVSFDVDLATKTRGILLKV